MKRGRGNPPLFFCVDMIQKPVILLVGKSIDPPPYKRAHFHTSTLGAYVRRVNKKNHHINVIGILRFFVDPLGKSAIL